MENSAGDLWPVSGHNFRGLLDTTKCLDDVAGRRAYDEDRRHSLHVPLATPLPIVTRDSLRSPRADRSTGVSKYSRGKVREIVGRGTRGVVVYCLRKWGIKSITSYGGSVAMRWKGDGITVFHVSEDEMLTMMLFIIGIYHCNEFLEIL